MSAGHAYGSVSKRLLADIFNLFLASAGLPGCVVGLGSKHTELITSAELTSQLRCDQTRRLLCDQTNQEADV